MASESGPTVRAERTPDGRDPEVREALKSGAEIVKGLLKSGHGGAG